MKAIVSTVAFFLSATAMVFAAAAAICWRLA